MLEVERYYRILDLEPGASAEEVHQGYLDLTWVWHPDRFAGHPRLQQKAQCKLQELNEAHERLRSFQPTRQKRTLHTNTKSQVSPPARAQSSAEDLREPRRHQTWEIDDKKTAKDCKQHVSFKTRDVNEWLD